MKKKRLISALLCAAMLLGSMPAYFAGAEDAGEELGTEEFSEPVIQADSDLSTAISEGLIAHLKLDDDVVDETGAGTPQLKGSATYEQGISGKAIRFDGDRAKTNSNRIELADREDLKFTKDSTYSAGIWLNATSPIPDSNLMGSKSWNKAGNPGWCLATNTAVTNGRFRFVPLASGGTEYMYDVPSGTLKDGNWIYVVVTFEGSKRKVYMNGSEISTTTATTGTGDGAATGAFCIGADYKGQYGPGNLVAFDDVRIWNRALTAEEIAYVYNTTPDLSKVTVSGASTVDVSGGEEQQVTLSVKATRTAGGEITPQDAVTWQSNVDGVTVEPQGNGATATVKVAGNLSAQTVQLQATCRGVSGTFDLEVVKDTAAQSATIIGKRAVLKTPVEKQEVYRVEFRNQYGTILKNVTDHNWSIESTNGVTISGSNTGEDVTVNIPDDADEESTYTLTMQGAGLTETISARLINKGVIPANLKGKVENKLSFEDTTDADAGGTVTPVLTGTLSYTEGVQGKAASFSNGKWLDLGDYNLKGKTITMAFQSVSRNGKQDPVVLANKNWDVSADKGFVLAHCYNSTDFQTKDFRSRVADGDKFTTTTFELPRGDWMTLALTFEEDAYSIYQDGKLIDRLDLTGWNAEWMNNSSRKLFIGNDGRGTYGQNNVGSGTDYQFLVDNFTVYNGILNQNELEEVATVNSTETVEEVVVVHPLADVLDVDFSDGTVKDRSRYETEFVQAAGATVGQDAALGRNVLSLSGAEGTDVEYKVSGTQTNAISKAFTFETAFLVNEKKSQTIAGNTEKAGMSYEMNSAGKVELWLHTGSAYFNVDGVRPGFEVETGTWYHAVTTYDGTVLNVYLNGTNVYSRAASLTVKHPAAADQVAFSIGGDPRPAYGVCQIPLNGKVARLGLYSTALTKKQVQEIYKEFQTPEQLTVHSVAMAGADSVAANLGTAHTYTLDFLAENGKYVRLTDRSGITWSLENAPAGVSIAGDATGKETVDIQVDTAVAQGASFTVKATYAGVNPPLTASKTVQVTNDGTGGNIKIAVLGDFQLKSNTAATVTDNIKTALRNYKAKNVDVIMIPGDITDNASAAGYDKMWAAFDAVYPDAASRPKIVSCMGNHDYWNGRFDGNPNDLEAAKALYKAKMGVELNTHDVVKGYHFISISPEDDSTHGLFSQTSIDYLTAAIAQAEADDPAKPIFVMAHQHVRKKVGDTETPTVYLSDEWGNAALYDAMKDHPQIVFLSGHSHAPIDDERSIHQEDFTSIGTSSMNYLELEKGKVGGTKPVGYNTRAQSLYMEVTPDEITVERWDKGKKMGSRPNWVIQQPATKAGFTYTNEKRIAARRAPEFASGAEITVGELTENTVKITLPAATHDDFVHSYRVELKNKSNTSVADVNALYFSDFCKSVPNMASTVSYTLSGLMPSTEYEINIYAIESFGKESKPLSKTITTPKGTINPNDPKPAADVLNVTFDDGAAVDHSSFKTTLTPMVKSGGTAVSYSFDDTIGYDVMNCNDSALKAALNSTQMAKITNQYSIETVVKLDNVNKAQSIFANTQQAGISLEITSAGRIEMWAKIGSTQHKVGESENIILEAGRYYHLMGTYNGTQFALYVDGQKIATKNASGAITYKDLPTYIGGDTDENGNIQAPIVGKIALARLYSIGLSEEQVTNIYNAYSKPAPIEPPVAATISGPASITIPEGTAAQTENYTVAFQDKDGNAVNINDTENIVWSLVDAGDGISIPQNSTGTSVKLSVTNKAEEQKVTLQAEYALQDSEQEKITAQLEIDVKLKTEEPVDPTVPVKVEISGAAAIQVTSQQQIYQYLAKALNGNGAEIAGAEFVWTIVSSTVSGVGLNDSGALYVNASAGSGKVVIQAAMKNKPDMKAQITVNITGNTSSSSSSGGGGGRGGNSGTSPSGGAVVAGPNGIIGSNTNPQPGNNPQQEYIGGFRDMPKSHWASASAQALLNKGIISGDADGLRPDMNITREETVKVLLLSLEKEIQAVEGSVDVNTSQWAKEHMLSAKQLGIIQGDGNGNLNGKNDISRIDAMVMIARALNVEAGAVETLSQFTDSAQIPDYAKAAVAKLVEMGIVKGYTDGSIGANNNITRAELFALMTRIMK